MLNKKAVINNSLFYLQNYYKYRIREITQTLFLFIVKTLLEFTFDLFIKHAEPLSTLTLSRVRLFYCDCTRYDIGLYYGFGWQIHIDKRS